MKQIKIKRVYEPSKKNDAKRILVDRIWPRGLSREKANIDYWARDLAPSTELRRWYQHDPLKWDEFKRRYFNELENNPLALNQFLNAVGNYNVTLLFSSREIKLNNAHALKAYLISNQGPVDTELA